MNVTLNSIMSLLQSETYSLMRVASDGHSPFINLYETSGHHLTLAYKVKLLFLDETFLVHLFIGSVRSSRKHSVRQSLWPNVV